MHNLQDELIRVAGEGFKPLVERPFGGVTITRERDGFVKDPDPLPVRREPKVKSHRQWAQHTVDMDSFYHRKLRAKRGDARQVWRGMSTELAQQFGGEQGPFLRGKGLKRTPLRYGLYVQGRVRGFLDDINEALAWATAAQRAGLESQCIEE